MVIITIVINNTIDCNRFKFDQSTRDKVRKQLKISNDFVIGNIRFLGKDISLFE